MACPPTADQITPELSGATVCVKTAEAVSAIVFGLRSVPQALQIVTLFCFAKLREMMSQASCLRSSKTQLSKLLKSVKECRFAVRLLLAAAAHKPPA